MGDSAGDDDDASSKCPDRRPMRDMDPRTNGVVVMVAVLVAASALGLFMFAAALAVIFLM